MGQFYVYFEGRQSPLGPFLIDPFDHFPLKGREGIRGVPHLGIRRLGDRPVALYRSRNRIFSFFPGGANIRFSFRRRVPLRFPGFPLLHRSILRLLFQGFFPRMVRLLLFQLDIPILIDMEDSSESAGPERTARSSDVFPASVRCAGFSPSAKRPDAWAYNTPENRNKTKAMNP